MSILSDPRRFSRNEEEREEWERECREEFALQERIDRYNEDLQRAELFSDDLDEEDEE